MKEDKWKLEKCPECWDTWLSYYEDENDRDMQVCNSCGWYQSREHGSDEESVWLNYV